MIITNVTSLCNTSYDIFSIDELELMKQELEAIEKTSHKCPNCNTSDFIVSNGYYQRHFVTYKDDTPCDNLISIHCVHCTSCEHSNALLPTNLIPYSSYSPVLLFSLIRDYCTNRFGGLEPLAEHYDISVKTVTRIIMTYRRDIIFIQAVIAELAYMKAIEQITTLLKLSARKIYDSLYEFRKSNSYSFLQSNVKLLLQTNGLRPIRGILQ